MSHCHKQCFCVPMEYTSFNIRIWRIQLLYYILYCTSFQLTDTTINLSSSTGTFMLSAKKPIRTKLIKNILLKSPFYLNEYFNRIFYNSQRSKVRLKSYQFNSLILVRHYNYNLFAINDNLTLTTISSTTIVCLCSALAWLAPGQTEVD